MLLSAFAATVPTSPVQPHVLLDSSYPQGARKQIRFCRSGCDFPASAEALQQQIDKLPCKGGGELVINAGEQIVLGPGKHIVLRAKNSDCDWIVIRSDSVAGDAAKDRDVLREGQRVSPSNATAMAALIKVGPDPAIVTEPGANHYRIAGLEIALRGDVRTSYALVQLGEGDSGQSKLSSVPHDLVIDRCFIHGTASADLLRAISLQSGATSIVDSYVSGAHWRGIEAQAIAGWNGPGPFKIVNNHLEGAGENVLFGGADPSIPGLVPSDIEFRKNLVRKDPSWKKEEWGVKNIFELKNARRIVIDGNIFENNWVSGQSGVAIVFTPRNQNGRCPWCVVEDVTFTNNIVRHTAAFLIVLGRDNERPQQMPTARVLVQNNLFYDCSPEQWGENGHGVQLLGGGTGKEAEVGPRDFVLDHNTILSCRSALVLEGKPFPSVAITDNVFTGNYGIIGTGAGEGDDAIAKYLPSATITGNVFVGRSAQAYALHPQRAFPATLSDIGMAGNSPGGTSEYLRYRLKESSRFAPRRAGAVVGADFDRLERAIGSAASPPGAQ